MYRNYIRRSPQSRADLLERQSQGISVLQEDNFTGGPPNRRKTRKEEIPIGRFTARNVTAQEDLIWPRTSSHGDNLKSKGNLP